MLHGSETWPVRKENEVALQRTQMRMVRWMCGMKLHPLEDDDNCCNAELQLTQTQAER